jgi:hypothetical protein
VSAAADWLEELKALIWRFGGCGIDPDLAGLSLTQAWGLLTFLRRVAAES